MNNKEWIAVEHGPIEGLTGTEKDCVYVILLDNIPESVEMITTLDHSEYSSSLKKRVATYSEKIPENNLLDHDNRRVYMMNFEKEYVIDTLKNKLSILISKKLSELREELEIELKENIDIIRAEYDKEFHNINETGKIKGYWNKLKKKDKIPPQEISQIIKQLTFEIIQLNIVILQEYVRNNLKIHLKESNLKSFEMSFKRGVFVIATNQAILDDSVLIFREKIYNELYLPLEKKRLDSVTRRSNNNSKKQLKKEKPQKKEIVLKIRTEKKELSRKKEKTMRKIIDFFAKFGEDQRRDTDEKIIRRLLLSKSKNTNMLDHLAERFKIVFPQKGDSNWKEWRSLMAKSKNYEWSIAVEDRDVLSPSKEIITEKYNKPNKIISIESLEDKLYKEISEKHEFTFKDFQKVIKVHEGFFINERAFSDFQKEFKPFEQKRILLRILKNKAIPGRNKANQNSLYYKWQFLSKGWRIVSPGSNGAITFFYRNHDDYEDDLRKKKF